MSRPLKDMITQVLRNRYQGVAGGCVVDLTGMTVESTTKLRQELRKKKVHLEVVKNSLARRAFSGGPLAPLTDRLNGPSALVTGGGSAIELAKFLTTLAREYKELKLRDGLIEGDKELVSVESLAKMKGKRELMSELAMLLASPARRLAGCLQGPGGRIAGAMKSLADKEDQTEAAA